MLGPGSLRPGAPGGAGTTPPPLVGVLAIEGVAIEPWDTQPSAGAAAVLACVPGTPNRVRAVGLHDTGRPGGPVLRGARVTAVLALRGGAPLPGTPAGGHPGTRAGRDLHAVLPATLPTRALGRYELRLTITYRGTPLVVTREVQGRTYLGGGPTQFR